MKKIRNFGLLILAVIFMAGCFSVETHIKLNKDGSGTLEEKVMVKPMNMFGQNQSEPEDIYDEAELRSEAANYGEGVSFKNGKSLNENGMSGYLAVYAFKDINKLKLNENFAGKAIDMEGFGPMTNDEKNDHITFQFKKGGTSQLKIIYPVSKESEDKEIEGDMEWDEEADEEMDEEMLTMMQEMYRGMKFSIFVTVEGKIKDTNATYHDDSSVTLMDFDFSD